MNQHAEMSAKAQIEAAGQQESQKILTDAKRRDWGRPGVGTFLFPVVGTIAGLFAKGPEYRFALLNAATVKSQAELNMARQLLKEGNKDASPELCAQHAEKYAAAKYKSDNLPADNKLLVNTGIGFLAGLFIPLPVNIFAYGWTAWSKSDKVTQVNNASVQVGKEAYVKELDSIQKAGKQEYINYPNFGPQGYSYAPSGSGEVFNPLHNGNQYYNQGNNTIKQFGNSSAVVSTAQQQPNQQQGDFLKTQQQKAQTPRTL